MSGENYILFLKLTKEIPSCFYHFADHLAKLNITLIPVDAAELPELATSFTQHLMVYIPDLLSLKRFNKTRKEFLDFALVGKKFTLFEMSSFAEIPIAGRLKRQGLYHHFKLPTPLEQVLRPIALTFYQQNRDTQKWPGGKRAKLPTMN